MEPELFSRFATIIRSMSANELDQEIQQPQRLLLESSIFGRRKLDVAYAPFDFINRNARVVIVGLTPGRQQMRNALHEERRLLLAGASLEEAAQGAKVFASFSGPMRANLVGMLDHIGVAKALGVATTALLWNGGAHIAHFTSALRYPVFVNGANYSGSPDLLKTPLLVKQLRQWFATEMAVLPDALFVPLGPKVGTALIAVADEVGINQNQILAGLPHPSGANGERIACFLGRKPGASLSKKTNPDKLFAAREALIGRVQALRG